MKVRLAWVLALGLLVMSTQRAAVAGNECFLDQNTLSSTCELLLREEGVQAHCQDLGIKSPRALGSVCADRIRKAGGQISCRYEEDIVRLLPGVVGRHCKVGDRLVLQDPTRPRFPGRSSANWVGTPYDQSMMTRFCSRDGIKKLDIGDYACVIDRGL